MYRAVMKPAFPAVVYTSPHCCRPQAAKKITPHSRPAVHWVFFSTGGLASPPLSRLNTAITGSRTSAPRMDRAHWKVNGPIKSMLTLWATRAAPQIMAVSSSKTLPLYCCAIVSPPIVFCLSLNYHETGRLSMRAAPQGGSAGKIYCRVSPGAGGRNRDQSAPPWGTVSVYSLLTYRPGKW